MIERKFCARKCATSINKSNRYFLSLHRQKLWCIVTLVQLEYILALDTYRNFSSAAEKCFVTQPTLSMQVQKLEEELDIKIFDRSKKPLIATELGREIIDLARSVLSGTKAISDLVSERKGEIKGELHIGIIPTLAPYLLPLFLKKFLKKYEEINLTVVELTTERIIEQLKRNVIDAAILVTPLEYTSLKVTPLFYEEFILYSAKSSNVQKIKEVSVGEIDVDKLWLLEEGHCFRSQIINLCDLQKVSQEGKRFHYEAGSLETLIRMVDQNQGITILPELAMTELGASQKGSTRRFKSPVPVREVSLVTHRDFVKKRLIEALRDSIIDFIPDRLMTKKKKRVISID